MFGVNRGLRSDRPHAPLTVLVLVAALGTACGGVTATTPVRAAVVDRPVLTGDGWHGPSLVDGAPPEHVAAIDCLDASHCVAVGAAYPEGYVRDVPGPVALWPLVSTFDGARWSAPAPLGASTAVGASTISCASRSFCLATDGHGMSYVLDGRGWSKAPMPGFTSPGDSGTPADTVSCVVQFCLATTDDGMVTTYRSGRWSLPHSVRPGFSAHVVGCLSSQACAVGGAYGVLTSAGTRWVDSGVGNGLVFYSLTCTPRTHRCRAVGQDGYGNQVPWVFDGHTWTVGGT